MANGGSGPKENLTHTERGDQNGSKASHKVYSKKPKEDLLRSGSGKTQTGSRFDVLGEIEESPKEVQDTQVLVKTIKAISTLATYKMYTT